MQRSPYRDIDCKKVRRTNGMASPRGSPMVQLPLEFAAGASVGVLWAQRFEQTGSVAARIPRRARIDGVNARVNREDLAREFPG